MRLVLPRNPLLDKATIMKHILYRIQRVKHDDIQYRKSRHELVVELLIRSQIGMDELQRNSVFFEVIKMVKVLPTHSIQVGIATEPPAEIEDAIFPLEAVVARYFGTPDEFHANPEELANILYGLEKEIRDIALRIP